MKCKLLISLILLISGSSLFAGEPSVNLETLVSNLNIIWTLVAAALVFLMQAGFMCLESGMCRAKNSINIAIKNMCDLMIAVSGFWLIGYGIMFGENGSFLGGWIGSTDYMVSLDDDEWMATFFVFQAVFVGAASTITSGAVAERANFIAYLVISLIISTFIYPVFGHWAWGSLFHGDASAGWLEGLGFYDFAGSTVVHSMGGWIALAAAIMIGPRIGRFCEEGKPRKIQAHSLVMVYLGTFILFFGWFGFNCGSTTSVEGNVGMIAVNTILSGCFGGLSAKIASWVLGVSKKPDAEMIANGVLGGLVGVTAGCDAVGALGAVIIGIVSGLVVYFGTHIIERKLKIDDVVGAIPVHGMCGAWGTIATGIFMLDKNLSMGRWEQVGVQFIGVITAFVWGFGIAFIALWIIKKFIPLRVSEEDERIGLNISEHGASSSLIDLANAMESATRDKNYDLEVEIEEGTEVGDLARSFNSLVKDVKQNMNEASEQLKKANIAKEEAESAVQMAMEEKKKVELEKARAQEAQEMARLEQQKAEELARREDQKAKELQAKVEQILEVSKSAKAGDLTKRINFSGDDVIGQLADGLQSFFDTLSGNLSNIRQNTQVIAQASEDLDKISVNLTQNSADASQNIDVATLETQKIEQMVEVVSQAANQISTSINDVSQKTTDTADIAQNSASSSEQVFKDIASLNDEIMSIKSFIKTIAEITEQTNLLALNATIEASRAGEQGKGFAVVASEVKNLARSCEQATQEITQKIDSVLVRSKGSIKQIEQLKDQSISVDHATNNIATSMEEQQARIGEISSSISNVFASIKEITQMMNSIKSGAEEATRESDTTHRSASNLSNISKSLDDMVNYYQTA